MTFGGQFEPARCMTTEDTKRPDLGGMTLNERLFSAGLLDEWDAAVRRHDRAAMITILGRAGLSEKDAAWSVDMVLADPGRYGF